MNTQRMPQLIGTITAAELLGVSRMTVIRWINGDGVAVPLPAKKVGRGYRISEPELYEWFNNDTSQAA